MIIYLNNISKLERFIATNEEKFNSIILNIILL